MPQSALRAPLAALTAQLAGRPLDAALDAWLNAEHGAASPTFATLQAACRQGVAEGWLCNREGGGIRYGRVFKPADDRTASRSTWSTWTGSPARTTPTRSARST